MNNKLISWWSYSPPEMTIWDDANINIIGINLAGGNQGRKFTFKRRGTLIVGPRGANVSNPNMIPFTQTMQTGNHILQRIFLSD